MLKLKEFKPIILLQKRWKNKKTHWAVLNKKTFPKDRALDNLDDFYGSVFGKKWKSIRIALLTKHKYIAMVNIFGDIEKTVYDLELEGAINVKSLVELAKKRLDQTNLNTEVKVNDSNYKMVDKLNAFRKQKEVNEKLALYPPINMIDLLEKKNNKNIEQNLSNKKSSNIHDQMHNTNSDKINTKNSNNLDENISKKIIVTENTISSNQSSIMNENILESIKPINVVEQKNSLNDIVDYKKSLEQRTIDDLEIDHSRLVNLEQGSGGLHEYIPATNIKGMEDWIPESDHYKYYSITNDFPILYEKQNEFIFPENLFLYTYEKGNCSSFISPFKSSTDVHSHYLMDGASILPPLLLNIEKGDIVLDACAAPGGKSLLMLQTLYPELLVCNDVQDNRLKRIHNIMKQYIIDFDIKWNNKFCNLTKMDARIIDNYEQYDKILVDVPCTTDRHSVMENDNNIFKPTRIKERLKIPERQSDILANCIRLLKPGGSLIYSTCSLSPIQNDGVVHMGLQKVFNDYGITTTIIDLSSIIKLFEDIFMFENSKNMKYGQLVLPFLPANFGPMYFCKIKRN